MHIQLIMLQNPNSLTENPLYLAGELTHRFHRRLAGAFRAAEVGVTVEQFGVLALLYYQDGLTQQEMAEALGRDKASITRILHNMERDALLERGEDSVDKRSKRVALTPLGKQKQEQMVQIAGALYYEILADLSAEQVQVTCGTLGQMLKRV